MHPEYERLRKIKLLAFDVDGILTDCRVFMDSNGEWKRFFCVRDGAGIKRVIDAGYQVALITGSKANDIRQRAKILGIQHLYEGSVDKKPAFEDLLKKTGLKSDEISYMGDDYFDIPLLKQVGFAATVPECVPDVKEVVHWVTSVSGGQGAAREICDFIYKFGALSKG